MKYFGLLILSVISWSTLSAQSSDLLQDPRLTTLLEKHNSYNRQNGPMGYRINIFSESGNHSRAAATKVKTDFETLFMGVPTYLFFEEPYYKVRIGNFKNRMEASGYLAKIKGSYPNAFVVKDALNANHLLGIFELPVTDTVF